MARPKMTTANKVTATLDMWCIAQSCANRMEVPAKSVIERALYQHAGTIEACMREAGYAALEEILLGNHAVRLAAQVPQTATSATIVDVLPQQSATLPEAVQDVPVAQITAPVMTGKTRAAKS